MVTVESLFPHREQLRFCSCSSARGSIPSCPRVLSQAPTLEAWHVPPPCTDVATASCLRSVSHCLIDKLSHGLPAVILSSRCFYTEESVTNCAHITSVGLPQCLDVMSWPEEATCCACKQFQRARAQRSRQLKAAAAVQLTHNLRQAMRTTWLQIVPRLTSRGGC